MFKLEPRLFLVTLVGANGYSQGNVYASNYETGVFGPVCDDAWNLEGVIRLFIFLMLVLLVEYIFFTTYLLGT